MIEIPEVAARLGFVKEPVGTHIARTLMLKELRGLLSACPASSGVEDYRAAVVQGNALLKATLSTRIQTFRRLRELYALDRAVVLFRVLRDLWDVDGQAQPLLAMLCTAARDPIVRVTADTVLTTPVGGEVTPGMLAVAVSRALPGRYNEGTLATIGRHCASSWQQSGHLKGRLVKTRTTAEIRASSVAYALLLGHLCGDRGDGLFATLWARLLDAPVHVVRDQAVVASQQGWLEYRHAGDVTDISFRHFLGNETPE